MIIHPSSTYLLQSQVVAAKHLFRALVIGAAVVALAIGLALGARGLSSSGAVNAPVPGSLPALGLVVPTVAQLNATQSQLASELPLITK